jgi:hypothetical protein
MWRCETVGDGTRHKAAPGYDVYALERDWKEWIDKKGTRPENPDKAFIGFCRRKAKQRGKPSCKSDR